VKFIKDKRKRTPEESRKAKLKHRYSISVEEYDEMFQRQRGVCKVCGKEQKDRNLAVDHCHTTNLVRGLLCIKCNRGIGFFEDSQQLLQKAINYLKG